ncbi:MAG: sigma-70 family RNA polymerase sigma factor [Flammeovirgaceae bacterium]|jgi:RNA polymerase sigma factor (sigma-70 family)|nr:sigma-70 family RNA polymerase sigma factor [Flammeovirgaceae bacterium]|tara:strand:+ start:84131 stop:84730 length:600 start_codon:yes stop_codon:yes gene_type:complete
MKNVKISDRELLLLYKQGDEQAFSMLLERHKDRVYTTVYLIVKDKYLAEDLLQEVFIKAITMIKADRYKDEGKFLSWILRIAHNMAIDQYRKAKRSPIIMMEDGSNIFNTLAFSETSFEDVQIKQDTHDLLKVLIKELPDSQREVLVMRHYMQMSFQEIAASTNVSINTALGRMRYALINLRKKLQQNTVAYDPKLYPT